MFNKYEKTKKVPAYYQLVLIILAIIIISMMEPTCAYTKNNNKQPDNKFSNHQNKQLIHYKLSKHYADSLILPGSVIFKIKDVFGKIAQTDSITKVLFSSYKDKFQLTKWSNPYPFFKPDGIKYKDYTGIGRIREFDFPPEIDPIELCFYLEKQPEIEYACPLIRHISAFIPDDSLYSLQKELTVIHADSAWDISQGSSDALIAIVDTEVDWQHIDLAANIWTNPGESGLDSNGVDKRYNGIDDDGNGLIDDWHGWDFGGNGPNGDNDTKLSNDSHIEIHGTCVAGCAAAVTNNEIGIASIGYHCKLLPIKTQSDSTSIGHNYDGILYAATMGATVINCSWLGVGYTQQERDIIKQVWSMGSLIVAAAGNSTENIDTWNEVPKNNPYLIYVGASTNDDSVARFSCYGVNTGVFAPGLFLQTTYPNNEYRVISGTSLSAPMVCGLAGLIKSLHPNWTPGQIKHQFRSTSDQFHTPNGDSARVPEYYGRINAYNALKFNKTFDSQPAIPGVEVTDFQVESGSGMIDLYSPVTLKLKIKNYLAPVENLVVSMFCRDSLVDILNNATIPVIGTLGEEYTEITVKLDNKTRWYNDNSTVLIKFESPGYVDYQLLNLPLKAPTQKDYYTELNKVFSLKDYIGDYYFELTGLSSPNPNVLWGIGNIDADSVDEFIFCANRNGTVKFTKFYKPLTAAGEICGVDESTALSNIYGTSENSKVYKTTDGGDTWFPIKTDDRIHDIYTIKFSDKNNGFIYASNIFPPYLMLFTTNDGGKNWNFCNSLDNIMAKDSLSFYQNFLQIFDGIIWTRSANNIFYRSKDYSKSWKIYDRLKVVFDPNAQYLYDSYYLKDNDGMIIYFNNDRRILSTAYYNFDSNQMVKDSIYITTNNYSDLIYFHNSLLTGSSVIVYEDGSMIIKENPASETSEWQPVRTNRDSVIKYPVIATGSNSGRKSTIWIATDDNIYYMDFDNIFNPPDTILLKNSIFYYFNFYPNPVTDGSARLQVYSDRETSATLKILDYTGKVVQNSDNLTIQPGNYNTILINCDALASGLYFYELNTGTEVHIDKFIVFH